MTTRETTVYRIPYTCGYASGLQTDRYTERTKVFYTKAATGNNKIVND